MQLLSLFCASHSGSVTKRSTTPAVRPETNSSFPSCYLTSGETEQIPVFLVAFRLHKPALPNCNSHLRQAGSDHTKLGYVGPHVKVRGRLVAFSFIWLACMRCRDRTQNRPGWSTARATNCKNALSDPARTSTNKSNSVRSIGLGECGEMWVAVDGFSTPQLGNVALCWFLIRLIEGQEGREGLLPTLTGPDKFHELTRPKWRRRKNRTIGRYLLRQANNTTLPNL